METMLNEDDPEQQRVKYAIDPAPILNPGRVFPVLYRFPELPRFQPQKIVSGYGTDPGSRPLISRSNSIVPRSD